MTLKRWVPVSNGERRKVTRMELNNRRKKKAYERLQRNTNQPLTRSLRSQLSMTRDEDGYSVSFHDRKSSDSLSGGRPAPLKMDDSSGVSDIDTSFTGSSSMNVFAEEYLRHTSLQ
mmetsp:Transcript_9927/g.13819  ORF Transcript_9927/g.13819 Transcript_9927/m.13819 type:complete len:116 (+) Transcript_9927:159-506(+)